MKRYVLEWDAQNIKGAIQVGFNYMECMDLIVGFICARPDLVKKIIFSYPDEFKCDFIPNGVGLLRTAYVLYKSLKWNEIRFIDRDKTTELQIILISEE